MEHGGSSLYSCEGNFPHFRVAFHGVDQALQQIVFIFSWRPVYDFLRHTQTFQFILGL